MREKCHKVERKRGRYCTFGNDKKERIQITTAHTTFTMMTALTTKKAGRLRDSTGTIAKSLMMTDIGHAVYTSRQTCHNYLPRYLGKVGMSIRLPCLCKSAINFKADVNQLLPGQPIRHR